jgi:transcriptional regulator with GAF, ATPase, and Fis domain
VITAPDGRLDLCAALPGAPEPTTEPPSPPAPGVAGIRTVRELEALERDNILRALDATGWRVAGKGGAADLLEMRPSTLASRIKVLGLSRPR